MIISWFTGGLGNQMFQYAAGLALASQRRTELKLDVSWFDETPAHKPHERYALSAFGIAEQVATREEIDCARGLRPTWPKRWSATIVSTLRLKPAASYQRTPGNWHTPPTFAYYPGFLTQPDNTYLHGMFQSERFFAPVAGLLRSKFSLRQPDSPAIAKLAERIRQSPSAFVHFRRGDYIHDPLYAREIGVLGPDYYQRAVRALRDRHPNVTLYLFSDDIESVAHDFTPPGPHVFIREPAGTTVHDVLRLMSLCDHAIIANSTLSWWGAWLNASPQKLVIAPEPWFAGTKHDTSEVVPTNWLRLPARFRT
jgi:hypothetical protein